MADRVHIQFANAEGALVRILGLIERRGYRLLDAEARGGSLTLGLSPRDPGRRLDVLACQIRRLHDVIAVTPFPAIASVA